MLVLQLVTLHQQKCVDGNAHANAMLVCVNGNVRVCNAMLHCPAGGQVETATGLGSVGPWRMPRGGGLGGWG